MYLRLFSSIMKDQRCMKIDLLTYCFIVEGLIVSKMGFIYLEKTRYLKLQMHPFKFNKENLIVLEFYFLYKLNYFIFFENCLC